MKIEFEWNDLVDLVDEASADDINKIAHAISDIITVVNSNDGGNVDLSNYFTKDEVTQVIDFQIQNVYGVIDSEIKIIDKEKEDVSNKANSITDNGSNSEKYPSTKAVYEYGQGIVQASETYTEAYVAQETGNIETALENIIEKYGLGGDAS